MNFVGYLIFTGLIYMILLIYINVEFKISDSNLFAPSVILSVSGFILSFSSHRQRCKEKIIEKKSQIYEDFICHLYQVSFNINNLTDINEFSDPVSIRTASKNVFELLPKVIYYCEGETATPLRKIITELTDTMTIGSKSSENKKIDISNHIVKITNCFREELYMADVNKASLFKLD